MSYKFVKFIYILKEQYNRIFVQSIDPESIRRIREKSGLGRAQLAKLLGTYEEKVRGWENGRVSPTPDQTAKLREFEIKLKKGEPIWPQPK